MSNTDWSYYGLVLGSTIESGIFFAKKIVIYRIFRTLM